MTETPLAPMLAARDLYKIHAGTGDDTPVLRGVTFEVIRGEFVCIMGPSGSGKTTLLHLLSGLDEATAGSIQLDGQELVGMAEGTRTRLRRDAVGYVFQFFHLMPNLSVEENIALPLAIAGGAKPGDMERVRGLGKTLGIEHRMHAFPHELSGGEMQRASIARALIGDQPLLLCDEPTGNLSQSAGREVMEELRRAADEAGRTVVLVTHNPRDATFADRVLLLVDGELDDSAGLVGPGLTEDAVTDALRRVSI